VPVEASTVTLLAGLMPKRILLVDDNPIVRRQLRFYLETATGFEVSGEAINGRDAIEKAQELSPDLIILDFTMPVMNGLEAAKTLRAMMPEVRLILFTVHRSANLDSNASVAGINAVISKVEGVTALVDRVRSLLEPP
jgi:DNA-binding NarL/FixJ family response regulator